MLDQPVERSVRERTKTIDCERHGTQVAINGRCPGCVIDARGIDDKRRLDKWEKVVTSLSRFRTV